jgi:phosphatidylserine synthase
MSINTLKFNIMTKNMSNTDKGIRVVAAAAVALLYYFDIIDGTLAYILMAVAIIFLLTSLISFCPLYTVFGINTCKIKEQKK